MRGQAGGGYDGDLDALVSNNGEPPTLPHNEGGSRGNWLRLPLVATKSNPTCVGTVTSWKAGGVKSTRLMTGSGGS